MEPILLDGKSLTLKQLAVIARRKDARVELSPNAHAAINASRVLVEQCVREKRVVYGLTTGFGFLKNVTIEASQTATLQENLIRSHSVGVGRPYSEEVIRAAIAVRVNSLARGYSGVRKDVLDALIALINNNIFPFVPEQGSVGASGDLAPLSHLSLVIMGEGECWKDGTRVSALDELKRIGLAPLKLSAKEGLALINGTSFMTAVLGLAVADAEHLTKVADIAGAMSVEVLMGSLVPFHKHVHELRPHPGQISCADNIRRLCEGSGIIHSHVNCDRVQDSYSLRCIPQVHGACRDAITFVRTVIDRELNAVTDNPLIFPEENETRSAGNFHGEPLAIAADVLGIAVAEIASISERRIAKMVDPTTSDGLPAFLVPKTQAGVSSGYMISQYTAAALVSENKVLAHPASVDSIPTSANQEDHVSMGSIATRKAREIIKNVYHVLAIELLCGAQAADFRTPYKLGTGTDAAHKQIRAIVPTLERDRVLYHEIHAMNSLIRRVSFLRPVEELIGTLL